MRFVKLLCAIWIIAAAASVYGAGKCNISCAHSYTRGATYPFLEMITLGTTPAITGNSNPALAQWYTVQAPCVTNNGELHGSTNFNALIRAQYAIVSSTAPSGSNFETQILVYNNTTLVSASAYTRKIRAAAINSNNRQGEWFNDIAQNLAANTNYDVYVKVRLLANASITVGDPWVTAQGSPVAYGAAGATNSNQQVVGGSWIKIAEAPFTNNSSASVDISLNSYVQLVSGVAGNRLLLGFTIDGLSSGTHNQTIYVPSSFPDGVNSFDHIPNAGLNATIPAGTTHNVQLWAKNDSGSTTTVQYARVQAVGFPMSNGTLTYADFAGNIEAHSDWSPAVHPQPHSCQMLDRPTPPTYNSCDPTGMTAPYFGTWTKVGEVTIPAHSSANGFNWFGEGYIELLGRTSTWSDSWAMFAIEDLALEPTEKSVDHGIAGGNVPIANFQGHFFIDARLWGTAYGNRSAMWLRKVVANGTDQGSFRIGRGYLINRTIDPGAPQCEQ